MKGPRRLIEENELFASLVEDAQKREPDPRALQKMLDVLDAPVAPASSVVRGRSRPRIPDPRIALALVGAGALAVLGYSTFDRPRQETVAPVVATAPLSGPDVVGTSHVEPAPEAVPSLSISDLPDSKDVPSRGRQAGARVASGPTTTATPATKPSTARELELITRARAALTSGDGRGCLAAVSQHDAEFPDGQFMPEAAVMKIEATHASGDRAGARTLARAFLAKSPESPYAARIRSLLATLEQE